MFKIIVIFVAVVIFVVSKFLGNEYIVGSQLAQEGQFPYQVSVRKWDVHDCGGSIIDQQWVLTAAHCTAGRVLSSIAMRIGSRYNSVGCLYYACKVVQHEKYNAQTIEYDIALIKTTVPIEFIPGLVAKIELNTEGIGSGADLTLSGWGFPSFPASSGSQLKFSQLKSVSNNYCKQGAVHAPFPVEPYHICTYTKASEGFCKGDSGGPLVYKGKVAGIVSWNIDCTVGKFDVYTRVSSFVSWMRDTISKN